MKLNAITKLNLTLGVRTLFPVIYTHLDLPNCAWFYVLGSRWDLFRNKFHLKAHANDWRQTYVERIYIQSMALNSMLANELSENLDIVTFNFLQSQGNSLFRTLFCSTALAREKKQSCEAT